MKPKFVRNAWNKFSEAFPRLSCEIDLYRRNKYFEKDLWLIPQFCRSNGSGIDVGVNEGVFSRWMSKFCRRVDGFECNPQLIPKLRHFLPQNVHLHECALSSEAGTAVLRFDPKNTGVGTIESQNKLDKNPGIRSVIESEVPKLRLDDLSLSNVCFVKIDVEGHELEVLKGAVSLVEAQKPTLLIEIEDRHCAGNLERVPQWLETFGYQVYYLDIASNQLSRVNDIHKLANGGTNNFWFLQSRNR